MIPNEKYIQIAKGLLEKTKKQKVPWKPCLPGNGPARVPWQLTGIMPTPGKIDLEATEFMLSLPNSIVRLSFYSPPTQPDLVCLRLLDKNEHLAGSWNIDEEDENWPLAFELYEEVSKQVNKWDKVLEEVEEFIGKP